MDFQVKKINITKSLSNNHNQTIEIDISHGFFILQLIIFLLPLVKTSRDAENHKDYWTKLPWLARLNVYIILTTILIPSASILAIIFLLYKRTIDAILRLRYGHKFRGLLSGADTFWTLSDTSNAIVNILLVVRHENHALFHEDIHKKLHKLADDPKSWKLHCKHSTFMGFSYLFGENQPNITANIHHLNSEFFQTHDVLQATLSDLASSTIPGGRMWEVYIGMAEISWGGSDGARRKCYPLIVRLHHALGDGVALLQLVQRCFGETSISDVPKVVTVVPRESSKNEYIQQMVRITIYLMQTVVVFYEFPMMILRNASKKADFNCLHTGALCGEKVVAWKVENGYKYVNRVKTIKRRLKNAGFMDVIAASVSYGLEKYFKSKNYKINHINAVIPAITHAAKFTNMNTANATECTLTNRFSVGVLELPVNIIADANGSTSDCYWRCAKTIASFYDLRNSYEFQLNHWLLHIISVMPSYLITAILQPSLALSTLVISNLPGPRRIYFDKRQLGDNYVEDIVFWLPHRGRTGVGISIFTYGDRFQLGISIDKVCGVSEIDAEGILESIFDYIDLLYDDVLRNIYN